MDERESTQKARTVILITPRSRVSTHPMHSYPATLRGNGHVLCKLGLGLLPW